MTGSPGKWQPKKPEIRKDIQLGEDLALAEGTALVTDFDDAVHHEHVRRRQLGIARAKHFTATALQ